MSSFFAPAPPLPLSSCLSAPPPTQRPLACSPTPLGRRHVSSPISRSSCSIPRSARRLPTRSPTRLPAQSALPPQPFDHRPSTLHVPAVDTRYVRLTPRPLFRSPRSMPYPLNAMSSFSSTARLKTPSTLDLRRHANTTPSRPLHADPALQPTCAFILPSLRSRHRRCTLPSYLAAAPSTANTLAPSMSRTTATSSLYPLDLDLDPALVPLILGA